MMLWYDQERDRITAMAIEARIVTELEATSAEVDLGIGGAPFLYDLLETSCLVARRRSQLGRL